MRTALLGSLGLVAAGLITVGQAAPAVAAPACSDPGAGLIHEVHEAAGPAGGPVHVVEGVYCAVTPL